MEAFFRVRRPLENAPAGFLLARESDRHYLDTAFCRDGPKLTVTAPASILLCVLINARRSRPAVICSIDQFRGGGSQGPRERLRLASVSPLRRGRIVRTHQRQHLAQREPAVSGPLAQLSKKNATGEAPKRGRALAARKRAASSAARALRTHASKRPAFGQRLGRSSGRGWPPVLESSPSTGNCMRFVGGTR